MDLSPRHRVILKALIEEFLEDNKPVGSKTLSEKYDIGLSPASIRNVLADLESMRLLASRHTSGGRVPTEIGFRIYVDQLISLYELTMKEKRRIQEEYLKQQFKLDKILQSTSRILATLTNSAAVVLGPQQELDTVKHIELIHVHGYEVLMIVVMRSGSVINKNIFIDHHLSQESLHNISRYMNQFLKGYDLKEITETIIPDMMIRREGPEEFFQVVEQILLGMMSEQVGSGSDIYIDGFKNLYNSFRGEESRLECVMSFLEEKQNIRNFFSGYIDQDGIYTIIGRDDDAHMQGVSIILTNYRMGEKRIGCIGIVGPQYMNYAKALPLVKFTSGLVSEMITKISR